MKKMLRNEKGFVLAILFVTVLFVTLTITYVTSLSLTTYNLATFDIYRANAQMTSDAALDTALATINTSGIAAYTSSYSAETTLMTNGGLTTTYQIAVKDTSDPTKKVISVIARSKVNGATKITRRYELDIAAVTSGNGPASVVSGVGGLILNNNSRISGGDVIVNGKVSVSNNAQIGLSTNPVNLRVAYTSCPSPPTSAYPQVCTTGQPITANGPIYADVQAQGQTVTTNMSKPGLTSSVFAPVTVPGYDRPTQKAAVATTYAAGNPAIACGTTWPANLKITGNVSLSNNCTITILGNVWITGTLTFGNNAKFTVSNTLGATRPVFMVDGSSGIVFGNNSVVTPNSSSTGIEFITMWWNTNTVTNGNFNCGGIADLLDCTNVTGLALSTSQSTTTINFSNNSSASGSILRTIWSLVNIANNGAIGAVQGQTIQLGNNAVINFTSSIPGSSNLVTVWTKRGYMRVYQ
jgi:hypothetical protein